MISPQKFLIVWWLEAQAAILILADSKTFHEIKGEHWGEHWWDYAFYGVLIVIDLMRILAGRYEKAAESRGVIERLVAWGERQERKEQKDASHPGVPPRDR